MRSTFYTLGSAVNDDLIQLLKTLKATWVIVDDDADFAGTRRLLEVVPRVVYMTSRYIRSEWNTTGTKDYAEAVINIKAKATQAGINADLLWYGLLDKPRADKLETRRLSSWLSDVLTNLGQENMKLVVGNLDMSSVEKWEINNGYFDGLLQVLSRYQPGAVLGVYETTSVIYPYGAGYLDRWDLLEPAQVRLDKWPAQMHGQRNDLLRAQWLQDRAKKLNLGELPVVVTQLALGRTTALNSGKNTIYDALLKRVGSPMKTIEGPYSLKDVWDMFWPDLTFAQAYVRQLQWVESVYPSYIQAYALKSWGGEDQHDHSRDTDLHINLALANSTDDITEPIIDVDSAPIEETVVAEPVEDESSWPLLEFEMIDFVDPREVDEEESAWLAQVESDDKYYEDEQVINGDWVVQAIDRWKVITNLQWEWRMAYVSSDGDESRVRQYPASDAPVVGTVGKDESALIDPMQTQVFDGFIWLPIRINVLDRNSQDFSNQGWIRNDTITYRFQYKDEAAQNIHSPTRAIEVKVLYQENNQHHIGLMGVLHNLLEVMRKTDMIVEINDYNVGEDTTRKISEGIASIMADIKMAAALGAEEDIDG